ncbi:hypothetical protein CAUPRSCDRAFT_12115, partial [Caulochytrium protostelioides]
MPPKKKKPASISALERNRIAAHRCREKRKQRARDLQQRAQQLAHQQVILRAEIADLGTDLVALRAQLLRHAAHDDDDVALPRADPSQACQQRLSCRAAIESWFMGPAGTRLFQRLQSVSDLLNEAALETDPPAFEVEAPQGSHAPANSIGGANPISASAPAWPRWRHDDLAGSATKAEPTATGLAFPFPSADAKGFSEIPSDADATADTPAFSDETEDPLSRGALSGRHAVAGHGALPIGAAAERPNRAARRAVEPGYRVGDAGTTAMTMLLPPSMSMPGPIPISFLTETMPEAVPVSGPVPGPSDAPLEVWMAATHRLTYGGHDENEPPIGLAMGSGMSSPYGFEHREHGALHPPPPYFSSEASTLVGPGEMHDLHRSLTPAPPGLRGAAETYAEGYLGREPSPHVLQQPHPALLSSSLSSVGSLSTSTLASPQ